MPKSGMECDTAERCSPGTILPGKVALIDNLAVAHHQRRMKVCLSPAFELRRKPAEHVGIHDPGLRRRNQPAIILVSVVCRRSHCLSSRSLRLYGGAERADRYATNALQEGAPTHFSLKPSLPSRMAWEAALDKAGQLGAATLSLSMHLGRVLHRKGKLPD